MKQTSHAALFDFLIGHATNEQAATGTTVIIAAQGATASVDVRGGAPATRETDLLRPENTVDKVHAVVLSGGSAFGLTAASGVCEELEGRGIGLDTGPSIVPIVVGASLYDLDLGDSLERPDIHYGVQAVEDAFANKLNEPLRGNVGAGTGASVSKLAGTEHSVKSGLGMASFEHEDILVSAIVAVNALGDVYDPHSMKALTGPRILDDPKKFVSTYDVLFSKQDQMQKPLNLQNTSIACIMTNAKLNKAQAYKISQMSHDGFAHVIKPVHTTFDGDAIFTLASNKVDAELNTLGIMAQRALEEACLDAIYSAQSDYGILAHSDLICD
ncbi:MAG: P1 family peptidase [Coriobacteriia bacterium]|nr:P1 family peptidase [Coriobacteriia bacterium]